MASQICHIIYTQKYFESLSRAGFGHSAEKINRDEFLLGSVFPDIRRIDPSVKRQETHLKFSDLNLDFKALTSFEAGWKFHLFCDMRREDILNKLNFYSLKGTADFYNLPAKILEDEIVYSSYDNWEKVANYFNNPPFIETGLSISQETFRLWYAIIAKYIQEEPTEKTMRIFMSKQLGLEKKIDGIASAIKTIKKSEKAKKILSQVKDKIIE